MDEWKNGYTDKRILVVFQDGDRHFSKKEGICTGCNSQEIILDNKHIIPRNRIYRCEIIEGQ